MSARLSDVQTAGKDLFSVQAHGSSLIKWDKFGLRIGVNENALPLELRIGVNENESPRFEVAVMALVGGQFKFPKNTVLVSAVYAVSVSKRLLNPLRLEIQHCVDLTGRPGLSKYLKFAIAPVSTPSLPYQFRIIEGGEFSSDAGWYASINTKEFSLICILGMTIAKDDAGKEHVMAHVQLEEGERAQQQGKQAGQSHSRQQQQQPQGQRSADRKQPGGSQKQQGKERTHQGELAQPLQQKGGSTGIKEATTYAGLIYYEEKGAKDLVTFTAAKKLNTLLEVNENNAVLIVYNLSIQLVYSTKTCAC